MRVSAYPLRSVTSHPVRVGRSVPGQVVALAAAGIWSLIVIAGVYFYQLPGKRLLWKEIVTPGHPTQYIYFVTPAKSLYERDAASAMILTIALAVALLVAATDLALRIERRTHGYGVVALVSSAVLFVFSLFGLLWGVALIGPIAGLIALSSRPLAEP